MVAKYNTVWPRIQPRGFYLFLEVKSGGSIRGGLIEGVINFARKGKIFDIFIQTYAIMLFNKEIFPLLLINPQGSGEVKV